MRGDPSPFSLAGDERGVLCLHGFTGTAYEMRYLGSKLHERGMTVEGLVLPGHGGDPDDLDRITWDDWIRAIEVAFSALKRRCRRVAVVGQSLGGLLALELSRRRGEELSAICTLGSPLWLPKLGSGVIRAMRHTPGLARLLPRLPKLAGSDVADKVARAENPAYSVLPVRGILQLADLMDHLRPRLADVTTPLLVLHGARDGTAPVECAAFLQHGVSSGVTRKRILPRSQHLISVDVEKDVVVAEVAAFFERALQA